MYTIRVSRTFSAAHAVHGIGGRCEDMHGHNYRVEVALSSNELKKPGMVLDFREVDSYLQDILPDHKLLNEVYHFNPTAENLARHFFDQLAEHLPVVSVTVWENDRCCATYSPNND